MIVDRYGRHAAVTVHGDPVRSGGFPGGMPWPTPMHRWRPRAGRGAARRSPWLAVDRGDRGTAPPPIQGPSHQRLAPAGFPSACGLRSSWPYAQDSGLRDPAAAFPLPTTRDDVKERRDANRAVAVSAIGLAVTGLTELLVAVLTGSVGLLGDAIHNLSDVSTSAVVFLGFRLSRKPPTERYPYGLERAEDLAGIGIAVVIWASAAFAGYESIRKLLGHGGTSHVALGIAGAALGIVGNQVVARYKLVIGKRINSATLVADARHSWLDALSSLGGARRPGRGCARFPVG